MQAPGIRPCLSVLEVLWCGWCDVWWMVCEYWLRQPNQHGDGQEASAEEAEQKGDYFRKRERKVFQVVKAACAKAQS